MMGRRLIPSSGASPQASNAERKFQKRLEMTAKAQVRVIWTHGRIARKRKKFINNEVREQYKVLLVAVMDDLRRRRRAS